MTYKPEIKRLGTYLIEAGLITPGQVDVALNDQEFMEDRMKFGDVLVARGWIKQQTLDYLIEKVVDPEQQIARRVVLEDSMVVRHSVHPAIHHSVSYERDTAELETVIQEDLTQPEPAVSVAHGGRLDDLIYAEPVAHEPVIAGSVAHKPVTKATHGKSPIAQAQSLDGNQIFQIVMPPRAVATPADESIDPHLLNDRKSLSSLPDKEDDMNWVG
jgi:hypothetical protein